MAYGSARQAIGFLLSLVQLHGTFHDRSLANISVGAAAGHWPNGTELARIGVGEYL